MPRSERIVRGTAAGIALAGALLALLPASLVQAREMKVRRIQVNTTPPGAEVRTISGRRGLTPLSISERDIYPNTFPEDRLSQYGMIYISRTGCEPVEHRVTLEDVSQGIDIDLICMTSNDSVNVARPRVSEERPAAVSSSRRAASTGETLSERRLRQLKVLDELLEEGLISDQEERSIRKRIYERLNH